MKLKQRYISRSEQQCIDSEITFLKRKIKQYESGLALIPGTKTSNVVELFESRFGKARQQSIPCDSFLQTEDLSEEVGPSDAHAFRAVIGTLIFLARDRPDLLFTVEELSSFMTRPTLTAISRLRKIIGYLKSTGDYFMVLETPVGGQEKWKSSDHYVEIETYSDSD